MVAHGLPTLYALESVQSSKLKGFVTLKSPRESVSDAQVLIINVLV